MYEFKKSYIIAVSGGIDSTVLLDMLVHRDPLLGLKLHDDVEFIVAHVDHGIRGSNSSKDREFVQKLAGSYGLPFEYTELKLGPDASEEVARNARYDFLDSVMEKYSADGILIAHHNGDVIETAIINHIRGSGRRGYTALSSKNNRIRPILHMTKDQLKEYAEVHHVAWVEDSTNDDPKYLRNRIRNSLSKIENKELIVKFASQLQNLKVKNDLVDNEIANILQYKMKGKLILSRSWFVKLPHDIACELIYAVLQRLGISNVNRQLVERLTVALKVARPGTKLDVDKGIVGLITKRSLRFIDRHTLKSL